VNDRNQWCRILANIRIFAAIGQQLWWNYARIDADAWNVVIFFGTPKHG
jgi:hypothetical protein